MKMTKTRRILSSVLCMMLIAAMALFTFGCDDGTTTAVNTTAATSANAEITVLGEGRTVFPFTVTDVDGKNTSFEIHTDKETVGEALLELQLIDGDDSEFGLYVKTVNGTTLDYDKDGKYWAFYVNGNYAVSGVDTTKITKDESYSFKAE